MKFNIFSFQEQYYKKIAAVCTIFITGIGILSYLSSLESQNPNANLISFVVSIVYALALFILGLYLSSQSSRIQNRFWVVKEYYVSLCSLQSIFYHKQLSMHDYSDIQSFILFHQGFTGRAEKFENSYIKNNCFTYTSNYLKHEKKFLSTYNELLLQVNKQLNDYITKNDLPKKVPYPNINKIENFILGFDFWLENNLNLYDLNEQHIKEMHSQILKEYKPLFTSLKRESLYIVLTNYIIGKKIRSYRNQIETIYGQKLHQELKQDELFNKTIIDINNSFQEITNHIATTESNDIELLDSISVIKDEMSTLFQLLSVQKDEIELINDILSDKEYGGSI